jgi:hypothetical protein
MGDRLQHPLFDLLKLLAHLFFLNQMPSPFFSTNRIAIGVIPYFLCNRNQCHSIATRKYLSNQARTALNRQ